jgi:hypothetical protein
MAEHLSSGRKQMGVNQQNPSGTAAFTPRQEYVGTAGIETCLRQRTFNMGKADVAVAH